MVNLGLRNLPPNPTLIILGGPVRLMVSVLTVVFNSAIAVAMVVVWSVAIDASRAKFILLGVVLGVLFTLQASLVMLLVGVFKVTRKEDENIGTP